MGDDEKGSGRSGLPGWAVRISSARSRTWKNDHGLVSWKGIVGENMEDGSELRLSVVN